MKKIANQKGFTLVELLVVIVIIGILAVALLPNILGAPGKARDASVQAHVNSIITAIAAADSEGVLVGLDGCLDDIDSDLVDGDRDGDAGNDTAALSDYLPGGTILISQNPFPAGDSLDCGDSYHIELTGDGKIVVAGRVEEASVSNTKSDDVAGAASIDAALADAGADSTVFAVSYN